MQWKKKGKGMIRLGDHKSVGLNPGMPEITSTGHQARFRVPPTVGKWHLRCYFFQDLLTQLWAPLQSKSRENDAAEPEGTPENKTS